MLAVTRRNKIRSIVLEKKSVTIGELSKQFSVTEETIRRDLKSLEDEGVLTRTYGGAYVDKGVRSDLNLSIRESLFVENKRRMAKEAAELVKNGDSIFLDCSTTALQLCEYIADMRITVLTNSLKVTMWLMEKENIQLILVGGLLSSDSLGFFSQATYQSLQSYYVDKAFISCRSLHMEFGMSDPTESQAEIRKLVMERAGNVYIMADHTKLDRVSFIKIGDLDHVDVIITDTVLSPEWQDFCKKKQIRMIECPAVGGENQKAEPSDVIKSP
ncbi:MAG: DeoR/GlpR family DNA-binding transcription regulator [Christensenellales bacterium]